MLITLTKEEMAAEWRRRQGIVTDFGGAAVSVSPSPDYDALLDSNIRAWYERLLLTADTHLLPVEELKDEVKRVWQSGPGALTLEYPERGVRPVSVWMDGWAMPVAVFHSPLSARARLQEDALLRATPAAPVVVLNADRTLALWGALDVTPMPVPWLTVEDRAEAAMQAADVAEPKPVAPALQRRVVSLKMVARPADGSFTIDESLLNTIPRQI